MTGKCLDILHPRKAFSCLPCPFRCALVVVVENLGDTKRATNRATPSPVMSVSVDPMSFFFSFSRPFHSLSFFVVSPHYRPSGSTLQASPPLPTPGDHQALDSTTLPPSTTLTYVTYLHT